MQTIRLITSDATLENTHENRNILKYPIFIRKYWNIKCKSLSYVNLLMMSLNLEDEEDIFQLFNTAIGR